MGNVLGKIKRNIEFPIFALIYAVFAILNKTGVVNNYVMQVVMLSCIHIMMAESVNILNGLTGLPTLGQAGFMSVGAYVSAMITTNFLPVKAMPAPAQVVIFLLVTVIGASVAALLGFLIGAPALRLQGDYLAIVTLGFCEVIRAIWRIVPVKIAGGAFGLNGVPRLANFFWIYLFMLLSVYFCRNYMDSSYGRSSLAIRDNEIAAETMGIDTFRYKTIAFASSAFVAGVGGSMYAHLISYLHPDVFSYSKSSDFVIYLYAGGVGSISGAIMGAAALTILPEVLRFLQNWRLVIYGLLLLCVILLQPKGLFGGKEFAWLKLKTGGVQEFYFHDIIDWIKGIGKKKEKEGAVK